MKRVAFIEQMEHSECGLACLSMILSYYGHHCSISDLREEYDVPSSGASFLNLSYIGNDRGMNCKGFSCSQKDLEFLRGSTPFIAHWNQNHFVVIEKIGKYVHIVDPALGRQRISIEEFFVHFSGFLMSFSPNDQFIHKKKKSTVKFFWGFAKTHQKWIYITLVFSLLLQTLGLFIPMLTKWVTDDVIISKDQSLIKFIGLYIVFLLLLNILFSLARGFAITRLQRLMDKTMMTTFVSHLFNLPYAFFEKRTGGDLLFRSNSHLVIRQILSNRVVGFLIDGILLIGYAFMMLNQSVQLGLGVITLSILLFIVLVSCTRVTQRLNNKDVVAQSKVQSHLSEAIHGASDVKMLGIERQVVGEWSSKFEHQLMITEKKNYWNTILNTIASSVQFIVPTILLWYGSMLILEGRMTIGELLGFSALATMFMMPIVSIGMGYTELLYLGSYVQRLTDVLDAKEEELHLDEGTLPRLKGRIELKNVSYAYDSFANPTLKNIDLIIQPGEKIGVVGASGAGKSTLAKLLIGFYRPTEGDVLYDERSLNTIDIRQLRHQTGVILQETKLFHKSIFDNICPGEDYDLEKVERATRQANLHDEIMRLPMQYHSMLSEGGTNLSGGQRQRLLLARALYHDPSILILDEATSALDNLNENLIDDNISNLECTRIVIAHRLNTIRNADRIIVLDQGEIVEEGTHHELMMNKGHYYELYHAQDKEIIHAT
ncbi:MAG: peptidase domain-containing ABC transporter [Psychrobacillus sp.]